MAGQTSIRDWLNSLGVISHLLMGPSGAETNWGQRHVANPTPDHFRNNSKAGRREDGDQRVIFFHLNHTNPVIDATLLNIRELVALGWSIGEQGSTFVL